MKAINTILSIALALCLASCNGIFSGIYDEAPDDKELQQGFTPSDNTGKRYKLLLDATSYKHWHYINLNNWSLETKVIPTELTGTWDGKSGFSYHEVLGSSYTLLSFTETDPQEDAAEWQFAVHHFEARTNKGAVIETQYTSIAQLPAASTFNDKEFTADVWSTTDVLYDLTGMLAYHIGYQNSSVNQVLSRWVNMDFSTPPPVYTQSGKVYIVRTAEGKYAALQLLNYMSPTGSKGYLTIDILYPYE